MKPFVLQVAAALAFSCVYPLYAQQAELSYADVQHVEQKELEEAKQWALDNAMPERYTLHDASIIGLVSYRQGQPVFFTTHNQKASAITRTTSLHSGNVLGLDLEGSNMVIGVWDASMVFGGHQEHRTRIIRKESGGASNHATHVAGTLIAQGISEEARGMAPKARVHSYNWNFHLSEMVVEAENDLLISNHSYGRIAGWHKFTLSEDSSQWRWFGDPAISTTKDYVFGYYDREASNFDQITYLHPYYLPVVSAGNERDDLGPSEGSYFALNGEKRWQAYDINRRPISRDGDSDGFDTITSMALAKNVLTVGSVHPDSLTNTFSPSVFSSAGPTDDGRIKPDLVGLGEQLYSTIATGVSDYAAYSGTSMATPNIAGSLILLQQLSDQLLGSFLLSATLKGLVIHTATDLGSPGPDYLFGWGLLNAEQAAIHIQKALRTSAAIQHHVLPADSTFTQELQRTDEGTVKITLSWTDPHKQPLEPAETSLLDNTTPVLINNLNLRVIHNATNQEYYPYLLSRDNPVQPASKGENNVDPVEQITLFDAPEGLYTLVIDAPEGLQTKEQAFSLIVSGLEKEVSPVEVSSARVIPQPGEVMFQWSTSSQNEEGTFIVERAEIVTTDDNNTQTSYFQEIARIEAQGLSKSSTEYAYRDPLFIKGHYLYRILFLSKDQESKVLIEEFQVKIKAPNAFQISSIFPNPASSKATISIDIPEEMPVNVHIYNALGQLILSEGGNRLKAGRHFLTMDLNTLSQGLYFAVIERNGQAISKSFAVID